MAEPRAEAGRRALRAIVAEWFEKGYEAGNLTADVLADRIEAEAGHRPERTPGRTA